MPPPDLMEEDASLQIVTPKFCVDLMLSPPNMGFNNFLPFLYNMNVRTACFQSNG